jgi:hypothetical protein
VARLGNRLSTQLVPGIPFSLPLYADGDASFHSRGMAPLELHFERDAAGRAVRFTGTSPEGSPFAATRQP